MGYATNQNNYNSLLRHLQERFSLDFWIFILYFRQRFLRLKKRKTFFKRKLGDPNKNT